MSCAIVQDQIVDTCHFCAVISGNEIVTDTAPGITGSRFEEERLACFCITQFRAEIDRLAIRMRFVFQTLIDLQSRI